MNFKSIFVIASYSFREILKSRVLINVFFLGLAMVIVTFIAHEFTYGVPERVALDFGLGTLSLSSVAVALLMGVGLISKEVENRTLYMLLTRPIKRYEFLLGRVFGLFGILALNVILLGGMTLTTAMIMGGKFSYLIPWAIALSLLECLIILMIVVSFSLVTGPALSLIYTFMIYLAGHSIEDIMQLSIVKRNAILLYPLNAYKFIFPNLSKLNIKDYILYESSLSPLVPFQSCFYGIVYLFFLLILCSSIFSRKNLD